MPDPTTCPGCGGPADNGHDREMPPNAYLCTGCEANAARKPPKLRICPHRENGRGCCMSEGHEGNHHMVDWSARLGLPDEQSIRADERRRVVGEVRAEMKAVEFYTATNRSRMNAGLDRIATRLPHPPATPPPAGSSVEQAPQQWFVRRVVETLEHAVNCSCSCGGGHPKDRRHGREVCAACEVWHRVMESDAVPELCKERFG